MRATNLKEVARQMASLIAEESRPGSPHIHIVRSSGETRLFVPDGSRLYAISAEQEQRWRNLLIEGDEEVIARELCRYGLDTAPFIDDKPLEEPPLYALSLAIAQKCNMGCHYCYAGQGQFGGSATNMPLETAYKSVDLLLAGCPDSGSVQLSFLGGEPLINRAGIRQVSEYAHRKAAERNIRVRFAITTNGTLLTASDATFFEQYEFAVTVSLDGQAEQHDRHRPMKNGSGSYERIIKNVTPLLSLQQKMQVSARVTVSPSHSDLPEILDCFIEKGFHSVGFSPLLRSDDHQNEMDPQALRQLLHGMIECGLKFEEAVLGGRRYPFLNMVNALKEISRGTHRPYPCGAGAGYMGVSATGELSACHRFVNEAVGKMGDLETGIDANLQRNWLASRHVAVQEPCSGCWARYLCGGGCHHEVLEKGRTACDYIRGWLHYVIQAHERISRLCPNNSIL